MTEYLNIDGLLYRDGNSWVSAYNNYHGREIADELTTQAERIASLEAENAVYKQACENMSPEQLTAFFAEYTTDVEKLRPYSDILVSDNVFDGAVKCIEALKSEVTRITYLYNQSLKLVHDSASYEPMLVDGSDDVSAPVCEGCLGQGTVLQISDFDSDPIVPCPMCQPDHASVEAEAVRYVLRPQGWNQEHSVQKCIDEHWTKQPTLIHDTRSSWITPLFVNFDGELLPKEVAFMWNFDEAQVEVERLNTLNIASNDDTAQVDMAEDIPRYEAIEFLGCPVVKDYQTNTLHSMRSLSYAKGEARRLNAQQASEQPTDGEGV